MFLNSIKNFILKQNLKKTLCNVNDEALNSPIIKVGLIIDESNFLKTSALKKEIVSNGISENNIKVIVFRDVLKSKEVYSEPTFGLKDLNVKGEFTQQALNEFISEEFDLLINYYDSEKPFLLFLTNSSKSKFKVGFSAVDKRLNHFLISIDPENYKEFIGELFRYLKILNKI